KDIDIEVFAVSTGQVRQILSALGEVGEVGAAFQVFKLRTADGTFDISIPRRENKRGTGHRSFEVIGDPTMTVEEAAQRRDFTMNALSLDPLTRELIDPFGGEADLRARILRGIKHETFLEDWLRVLRGAQFAARFDLQIDPYSHALMRSMRLDDLPAGRLFEECCKGLLRSPKAGRFLSAMRALSVLDKLFPMLSVL